MAETLINIANSLIPTGRGNYHLKKENFNTNDIIKLIVNSHPAAVEQLKNFSLAIPAETNFEYCKKLYEFLFFNVKFQEDKEGYQFVKLPSQVWRDKVCDCKSFSLFIGACLYNKGISFKYRFASYNASTIPHHVYIVADLGYTKLPLDVVYKIFGKEKKLIHKPKDINMKKGLYSVAGIGADSRLNLEGNDPTELSEAEMDILIMKDRAETMKAITEQKRGVGTITGERYQDTIDMLQDTYEELKAARLNGTDPEIAIGLIAEDAINGAYSIAPELMTISGTIGKSAARANRQAKRKANRQKLVTNIKKGITKKATALKSVAKNVKNKTVKALKKVAQVAKKGGKALLKIATAPQRLIIKGILELTLPKAAPFFLYLFITDPKLLAKLSPAARNKRAKQEKIAKFIVNVIGMKEKHFMGILRNGIMKKFGKSPEGVLSDLFNRSKIGIGIAPAVIAAIVQAVPFVIELIKKLFKAFGKKSDDVSNADAPGESDVTDSTVTEKDIKNQEQDKTDPDDYDNAKGGGNTVWNTFTSK